MIYLSPLYESDVAEIAPSGIAYVSLGRPVYWDGVWHWLGGGRIDMGVGVQHFMCQGRVVHGCT